MLTSESAASAARVSATRETASGEASSAAADTAARGTLVSYFLRLCHPVRELDRRLAVDISLGFGLLIKGFCRSRDQGDK